MDIMEATLELLESDIPLSDEILRELIEKDTLSFEKVYEICGGDSKRGDKLIMILSGKRYIDIPVYGSLIKTSKMTNIAYEQHLLKNLFDKHYKEEESKKLDAKKINLEISNLKSQRWIAWIALILSIASLYIQFVNQ